MSEKETKRFKYVGPYASAPGTSWVEHFYHESVVVTDGVAETASDTSAEILLKMDFIPYEKWEKQEATRVEEERAATEERNKAIRKEAEANAKNAAETIERDTNLTKKEQKERDALVAQSEGEKPLFPVEETESSIEFNAPDTGVEGKE